MPEEPLNRSAERVISVACPDLTEAEAEMAAACVRRGWLSSGHEVERFEWEFAKTHHHRQGVACNSGSTALVLALKALRLPEGARVLCPTLTMVAVPNAIVQCGLIPVFVDSGAWTGNWDHAAANVAGRDCQAAVVAHLYGEPAHIPESIPRRNIIEDCAEAHYSPGVARPENCRMATFSFYANKIITTGEGGMVLCCTQEDADRLRSLRAHAFTPGEHFKHQELAYSYRMTDLQGAIGHAQHCRSQEIVAQRNNVAADYANALDGIPHLHPTARYYGPDHAWWVYPVVLSADAPVSRDELRNMLAVVGIETRSFFVPMHQQPHLRQFVGNREDFPVADTLAQQGFYLPLHSKMDNHDVQYIANHLRAILG